MPAELRPVPLVYPTLIAGTDWVFFFRAYDSDNVKQPFNWIADPGRWLVEMEVRDSQTMLLARLANTGTRDGDITLGADGVLACLLPGAFTDTLPLTRVYSLASDPRTFGYTHRGALPFDLIATDTEADPVERHPQVHGFLTVQQRVTE